MNDAEVRKLPIRRFWLYSRNIDRIASEFDFRSIRVSTAKVSEEAMTAAHESLKEQMGSILEFDKEIVIRDVKTQPDQIALLRQLAGQKYGDVYQ